MPLKYSGILDKLKSKIQTTSISDETVAKKVGGIADKTPKPTEQASKGPKARKLTSLADIDVDRNPLIKEATKVELKRLIESNPAKSFKFKMLSENFFLASTKDQN